MKRKQVLAPIFAKLKDLSITGNPVTDDHVMALADLRELEEVVLTGTKVSDDAAIGLKPSRRELRIRDRDDSSAGKSRPVGSERPAS